MEALGPAQFAISTDTISEANPPYAVNVVRAGGSAGPVSVTCSLAPNLSTAAVGADFTMPTNPRVITLGRWADGGSVVRSCHLRGLRRRRNRNHHPRPGRSDLGADTRDAIVVHAHDH